MEIIAADQRKSYNHNHHETQLCNANNNDEKPSPATNMVNIVYMKGKLLQQRLI